MSARSGPGRTSMMIESNDLLKDVAYPAVVDIMNNMKNFPGHRPSGLNVNMIRLQCGCVLFAMDAYKDCEFGPGDAHPETFEVPDYDDGFSRHE